MPDLLTTQQVADRLQVSVRTVRRAIASGQLAVIRIGATVRIHPDDLDAWIAARRERAELAAVPDSEVAAPRGSARLAVLPGMGRGRGAA